MDDKNLKKDDIQRVSNADEITALFALLGYNTEARMQQTPSALGITAEILKNKIRKVERIAEEEDALQIFLFELTSVTIATIHGLSRAFKNRSGNYLLVLTADYERIDFVLLERHASTTTGQGIADKGPNIRPRTLTINRRNPDIVAMRVLRRFSYTEIDADYQYDKLISAYNIADWSEPLFNNRALFSDHYLNERLPATKEWEEDPKSAYREIKKLFIDVRKNFANKDEETLRKKLLEPVFRILGFNFKTLKPGTSSDLKPDYELVFPETGKEPLAQCLTYSWNRFMDGKDENRDLHTPDENPGALVVSLLEKEKAPWVIMTNGKVWRLYSTRAHSRATNYYEIDLEETIVAEENIGEAFRYFWLFFRAEAFIQKDVLLEGQKRRVCFLDFLFNESQSYAKKLGDRLKNRVFEKIFPCFAEGFIAYIRNRNKEKTELFEENLDLVFKGTLIFLYRLLFLLYAESRDLLPVKETRGYWEKSLARLKEKISKASGDIEDEREDKLKKNFSAGADSTTLYDCMIQLFKIVDSGDASVNVPIYNGGLFMTSPADDDTSMEAEEARFLLNHKIPDRFLSLGLDLMTRDVEERRGSLVFIDYKSLGVRQLGSIYEGLLEFKLRIAEQKLGVTKDKKREVYVPFGELDERQRARVQKAGKVIKKSGVYLENDKHERKATGSYYTPDYIVKYIVGNTVGPLLDEKFEGLREKFRTAEKSLIQKKQKAEALKHDRLPAKDPQQEAYLKHRDLVDEFFKIRILDPAMGSGHFLVETVDYVTDRMLDFLNRFPWNPVKMELLATRQKILDEMNRQKVQIDQSRLIDVNLMKRHVLKRCIYGVDLNPMAVELAKVSLWLDCFTLGAPLSFLDHHIKCGNSLIGAKVKEVSRKLRQQALFGSRFATLMFATELMQNVGDLSDATVAQVEESRKEYREASDKLRPFKRMLDVYTSQWFGNAPTKTGKGKKAEIHSPAIEFLNSHESEAFTNEADPAKAVSNLSGERIYVGKTALEAAYTKQFFHWELEFPEIFFKSKIESRQLQGDVEYLENSGFDAVIGNPPYLRVQGLVKSDETMSNAFKKFFSSAKGSYDIYLLFVENGFNFISAHGKLGYILPSKFFQGNLGKSLRSTLTDQNALREVVDFGHHQIFEEASNYTCLLFLDKKTKETFLYNRVLNFDDPARVIHEIKTDRGSENYEKGRISAEKLKNDNWAFQVGNKAEVLDKIKKQPKKLGDITEKIFQGIATSADNIYVLKIVEEKRDTVILFSSALGENVEIERGLIEPFLMGKDVHRYQKPVYKNYVIFPYLLKGEKAEFMSQKYIAEHFPLGWKYLLMNKKGLEDRERGRFKKEWWCLSRPQNMTLYDKKKIMTPEIALGGQMTYDDTGIAHTTKIYSFVLKENIKEDLKYWLGVLNSKVLWFFLSNTGYVLRGGYFTFKTDYLKPFPIRRIDFDNPADRQKHDEIVKLVDQALILNRSDENQNKGKIAETEKRINELVFDLYDLDENERRVVDQSIV